MGIATPPIRVEHPTRSVLTLFTDLDGTLLDHRDYDWSPARPALARLYAGGHRLVPVTSKTLAETELLQRALGFTGPVVVENGAAVAVPAADAEGFAGQAHGGWVVQRLSPPYPAIRERLESLRRERGYRFRGFGDLTAAAVAELTGLDSTAAAAARERLASEPVHWSDDPARLQPFTADLRRSGLTLLRGGRFHHVLGLGAAKGVAIRRLLPWLEARGPVGVTVGLGDAPNDAALLAVTDVAVVIPNPRGIPPSVPQGAMTLRAPEPGPAGWNRVVNQLLDGLPSGPWEEPTP